VHLNRRQLIVPAVKRLIRVALLLPFAALAVAGGPVPAELIGIWSTDGAEFRGDAIWKGSALYLDGDGVGALVSGDGTDVLGVRVVLKSYSADTHYINIDLTENGQVVGHEVLVFDPAKKLIFPLRDPKQTYRRHANNVSPQILKALGL
jgi:hypothetical protein